jgi:hypothetical protein
VQCHVVERDDGAAIDDFQAGDIEEWSPAHDR